jgi:MoaA/NifB/PqqE/SkfB family radical SAM enzyme
MECKFITNGLAISYDHVIKPCCEWKITDEWSRNNNIKTTSLVNWHQRTNLLNERQILESGRWPDSCKSCEKIEIQNRGDSARLGGNHAYSDYSNNDITLEIRPGSVCNFACQTCWPEASSRVAQYHHQAKLIDIKTINSQAIENFDFLLPILDKIKNVVLLGGEPFYDKNCKRFLSWAQENLNADILMFTNGSYVDFDFLTSYQKEITLVFSLDAVGRSAEYIRFGTVWSDILSNFNRVKKIKNVKLRVNVTCSVYNYAHLKELIEFLCEDWPSVVTFGIPRLDYLREYSVPYNLRPYIIDQLEHANDTIWNSNIEINQQHNASNALMSIVYNLKEKNWNENLYKELCVFINKMDTVKNINIRDYSNFLTSLVDQ